MKTILFWAAPPLAGAIIGFVTNVIAIKMLFRPLREIRVFGLRLPFTPGILPRQRRKLADSIGAMVERELLTPELLRQRLRREDVREKLYRSLAAVTGRVLAAPPGELLGRDAGIVAERLRAGAEKLYPLAAAAVTRMLRRDGIRRELEARGRIFLSRAMLRLNALQRLVFSAAQYDSTLEERMPVIVDDFIDQIGELLRDAPVREKLLDAASAALGRILNSADQSLGDLLDLRGGGKEKLDAFLCAELLRTADEQLENALAAVSIRTLVADRINSLEMIRVERIILDVMANQLKWIDVFGAVLGLLIGLVQVLCSWLFR